MNLPADTVDATAPSEPVTRAHLLQVYVGDYTSMMTRINAFIALQFVPWPPLAVVPGLVVNAFNGPSGAAFDPNTTAFVVWLTAMAVQVAVFVYLFALYEVYNHTRYVETELRPILASLIDVPVSWGYERFLERTGRANDPKSGDSGVLLLPIIAIVFASYQRCTAGLTWLDPIFFLINLYALWNAHKMVRRVFTARKQMFRAVAA